MLSAVVLAKNEEANILNCLKTLTFCDEVIIIDDNSIDKTVEKAKNFGGKVYLRSLNENYAAQRNFGLKKAKGDWALFVDADERVSQELAKEITSSIQRNIYSGYFIKRQDIFLGKELKFGETANVKLLRLAKKDAGKWTQPVHEVWEIKGDVGELKEKLHHYPHPTITEFIKKINNYTDIESKYRKNKGIKTSLIQTILFPIGKFINNYFFHLGLLDGFPGLIMAFVMSLHSLIVRVKLKTS